MFRVIFFLFFRNYQLVRFSFLDRRILKSPSFLSRTQKTQFLLLHVDMSKDIVIGFEHEQRHSIYLFCYENLSIKDIYSREEKKALGGYFIDFNNTKFGLLNEKSLRMLKDIKFAGYLRKFIASQGMKIKVLFFLINKLTKHNTVIQEFPNQEISQENDMHGVQKKYKQLIRIFFVDKDIRINLLYSQVISQEDNQSKKDQFKIKID